MRSMLTERKGIAITLCLLLVATERKCSNFIRFNSSWRWRCNCPRWNQFLMIKKNVILEIFLFRGVGEDSLSKNIPCSKDMAQTKGLRQVTAFRFLNGLHRVKGNTMQRQQHNQIGYFVVVVERPFGLFIHGSVPMSRQPNFRTSALHAKAGSVPLHLQGSVG
ncbi:hypothetical protein MLD38_013591 [Melastoma candidum]|uniref:Uncharacterized protein n=1 Tax=Melastoma candidum TaxID=119954 RepID=A0ACB9RA75_9MYRT|nr:hypothetical protein MLD38_013591 [Melastoma candidum]